MKMRKELNNKGFSLVELMIATVLLSIIVAPLLHSFVTAGNTTLRSRQIGDATLVSKNIAETVEATSLTKLFNEPDPSKYFAGATEKKLYSYDDEDGYTEITNPGTANQYYLGVKGVQVGSSTFNAMIKMDAGVYRNASKSGINDVNITDYSNMDAVYAQSQDADDPDQLGWASFQDKANSLHSDWSPSSAEPVRTITLEVTQEDEKIYANLHFDYEYTYRYTEVDELTGEAHSYTNTLSSNTISYDLLAQGYSLASNGGKLPNIYVMYYPLYEDAGDTNDIIRIENEIAEPVKVFLVKERGLDLSGEQQYHASVAQYVPAGTEEEDFAVVYSNIREDLSNSLNRTPLAGVNYRIYRGNFFSRVGYFAGEHGDLVSKSDRNRIYEVTVQIFDAADTTFTTPLHTFRSTKLQ